jgi:hypothetical protein
LKELFAIDAAGGFEAALTSTARARSSSKKAAAAAAAAAAAKVEVANKSDKELANATEDADVKEVCPKPEVTIEKVSQNLFEQV